MKKKFCQYCGEPLENRCECEKEVAEWEEEQREKLEERQHKSGFYAFQDLMETWRNER